MDKNKVTKQNVTLRAELSKSTNLLKQFANVNSNLYERLLELAQDAEFATGEFLIDNYNARTDKQGTNFLCRFCGHEQHTEECVVNTMIEMRITAETLIKELKQK